MSESHEEDHIWMEIPFQGGDNQSVIANPTIPDSTVKKKSQIIAYNIFRGGVTRDYWRTAYISTHGNEADLLIKKLPSSEKLMGFVRNILHHIFRTALAV